jgi:ribosomal protein S26
MSKTVQSYEIDIRILFKTFYCSTCGNKLRKIKIKKTLNEEQKKKYYRELFLWGKPIELQVEKVKLAFMCVKCQKLETTDKQLKVAKIQKKLKKKVLTQDEIFEYCSK